MKYAFIAPFVLVLVFFAWRSARKEKSAAFEKGDVLFRSSFPDLQPHFHPANVAAFVAARRRRKAPKSAFTWNKPPGFAAAESADLAFVDKGEEVRLRDAQGAALASFLFAEHPEGGVVRLGEGKFTVNLEDPADPKVRYWHPKREFKWSKLGGWKVLSALAERPIESTRDSMRMSDSDSSSWSSSSSSETPAETFSGGGGTFDGGGASGGWDDAAPSADSGSSGDSSSTESATAY